MKREVKCVTLTVSFCANVNVLPTDHYQLLTILGLFPPCVPLHPSLCIPPIMTFPHILHPFQKLARELGPYETYAGSPASEGLLQFDLWGVKPGDRHDWSGLKARMAQHGLRNSLLVAPMPTASTAQILGNNESVEPFTRCLTED